MNSNGVSTKPCGAPVFGVLELFQTVRSLRQEVQDSVAEGQVQAQQG